jgi:hypothetical protein
VKPFYLSSETVLPFQIQLVPLHRGCGRPSGGSSRRGWTRGATSGGCGGWWRRRGPRRWAARPRRITPSARSTWRRSARHWQGGLRVTLKDTHWSALYREPMTCDFVGFFVQSVLLFVVSSLTPGGVPRWSGGGGGGGCMRRRPPVGSGGRRRWRRSGGQW